VTRSAFPILALLGAATCLTLALPAGAQDGQVTTVVATGGSRALFKIAVAPPLGDSAVANQVVDAATDPKSFTANLAQEGATIEPSSWRNIGAEGVVKGSSSMRGANVHLELRLFVTSRGADAVLKREYDVPQNGIRGAVHQFDNEVVKYLTGTAGSFGGRLVFSATTGRGQKGIFAIESDGNGLGRLQAVSNVALAPAVGPGGVYYAGGLPDGSYQLFKVGNPAAVLKHAGLIFGVAFGGGKMALVISQNGASDIWTGNPDGTGLTKLTNGGLNTHPAFGPGGQLAYVSNAGGAPQIYLQGGKRASFSGTYNMAPVWCNDPEGTKLLYMGRDGASWDIFSVDAGGGNMKRLTQNQGSNTYPACSPDGRMIAFFSTRGGLFISNPQGQNQLKIADVTGESLRWEGN
jgi:TolB protein